MAIQNILPDPTNKINAAGEVDSNGSTGPGFSGVSLTSQQPITVNRSNSGLAFRSVSKFQKFNVDIKYNSLTKDEFNVVYSFLLQRQASLEAFFVELPQYGNTSAGTKEITQDAVAGSNELTLANATNVKIGDLFSVTIPSDDTHVKVYKVTKITGNVITVSPQIQRFIDVSESGLDTVNFGQPKMRVISQGSDIQYSVDAKGLYSFSVKLEETLS
tara:strand:+ start:3523 stop:4170 length:648 start_codon:yes stop_codon:yes gene_type:complete